ncbi:Glyoxalase [Rhodovastum atsumiense]|uniref:Glyoxalase n=1 Tax=Rhodovastum atsumiense TaxID=504468 RepID=A0A5M6J128_9PROT|nr:VOC family protein [Rhodovastum atsumiense]KAA5614306.1 glyoxalase [Rhodovastum atsumiense]CAH2604766.1 Glyoxalase [Rhodovastum atsumiense]
MTPGPPPVARILETALYVADLARSEAFYGQVFGFRTMTGDDRMRALSVPGRGVLLLFQRGGSVEPGTTPFGEIPAHDGHGALHLAFAIPAGSLESWLAHLAAMDILIESRLDWPQGATSVYFRDPDEHSLEIVTPGLWPNDQDRPG